MLLCFATYVCWFAICESLADGVPLSKSKEWSPVSSHWALVSPQSHNWGGGYGSPTTSVYSNKLLCYIYTQCWKPWICMVRIKNTWMAGSATTQSRRYSKPALLHLSFRVSSKSLRLAAVLVSLCFCPPQKNLHFDNFFQCHCTSPTRWACPNMARNDFQNLEKLWPPI